MMKLVELIKSIAVNVFESRKPMIVQYGTMVQVTDENGLSWLELHLSPEIVLHAKQLVWVDGYEPAAGDCVVLLRDMGGQKYVVLGKRG